jgi:hypothetical protein
VGKTPKGGGDHDYLGSWLHHLILNFDIEIDNLPYVLAIIIANGGDFYSVKDSDGYSAYALLTSSRYPGQSCLGLPIYLLISTLIEDLNKLKL